MKTALKIFVAMLAFIAVLLPPVNMHASQQEATNVAYRALNIIGAYGFTPMDYYNYGSLNQGQKYTFRKYFYYGNDYIAAAGGCSSADDIDLVIYDPYGNEVDRDSDSNQAAAVSFRANYSGYYYVQIIMYEASATGVHWSCVYGYQ